MSKLLYTKFQNLVDCSTTGKNKIQKKIKNKHLSFLYKKFSNLNLNKFKKRSKSKKKRVINQFCISMLCGSDYLV